MAPRTLLSAFAALGAAHAYGGRVRRSPRGPKPTPSPRRRDPVVEPLESWGAFDVGRHRVGVSTVSWGDPACGWTKGLKRKKSTNDELFGMKDARLAYADLAAGGVQCWAVPACSRAVAVLGRAVEKAGSADPPKVVVHCAPSVKARLFGSTNNRNRYGFASVKGGVRDALEVLGSAYLDCVLAGPPLPSDSAATAPKTAGALAAVGNRVEAVGVANIQGGAALRKAHAAYARRGLRLSACYVDFNLIDNSALRDGTLTAAKELDVTVLARSPLAAGLGSGLCNVQDPTGGAKFGVSPKWRFRALRELAPIHDAMNQVASMVDARRADDDREKAKAQNRDAAKPAKVEPAQVALQWVAAKGAVPMPAVKTRGHASVVLGCQGWALTADEVAILDAALPAGVPSFTRKRANARG